MSAVRLAQYWVDRSYTMLAVGVVDESGAHAYTLSNTPSTYALAWEAVTRGMPLADLVNARAGTSTVSLEALEHDGRLAWPIFELVLRVASGERTKSEALGYGDQEFAPWVLGATM